MDAIQIVVEPTRRRLLQLVWSEERAAGELAGYFPVTFGAVSQHLGVLRQAGFVDVRKNGNRRMYRANRDRLAPYATLLETMWATKLDDLARAMEEDA